MGLLISSALLPHMAQLAALGTRGSLKSGSKATEYLGADGLKVELSFWKGDQGYSR